MGGNWDSQWLESTSTLSKGCLNKREEESLKNSVRNARAMSYEETCAGIFFLFLFKKKDEEVI